MQESCKDHNAMTALEEQNTTLRVDAERYHWMASQIVSKNTLDPYKEWITQSDFDAAIDREIKKALED